MQFINWSPFPSTVREGFATNCVCKDVQTANPVDS